MPNPKLSLDGLTELEIGEMTYIVRTLHDEFRQDMIDGLMDYPIDFDQVVEQFNGKDLPPKRRIPKTSIMEAFAMVLARRADPNATLEDAKKYVLEFEEKDAAPKSEAILAEAVEASKAPPTPALESWQSTPPLPVPNVPS